jgi:hypothetical protein
MIIMHYPSAVIKVALYNHICIAFVLCNVSFIAFVVL